MSFSKFKKLAFLVGAVLLIGGALFASGVFKKPTKPAPIAKTSKQSSSTNPTPQPAGVATPTPTTGDSFTYIIPAGWGNLDKNNLDAGGATNGIGHTSAPAGQFTVKIADAIPADATDLKNSTINELKNLKNFLLISNSAVNVDKGTGQKFVYTNGDPIKVHQEMYVIVFKQKTYFLLFSSADSDFSKQATDFAAILNSFKFK